MYICMNCAAFHRPKAGSRPHFPDNMSDIPTECRHIIRKILGECNITEEGRQEFDSLLTPQQLTYISDTVTRYEKEVNKSKQEVHSSIQHECIDKPTNQRSNVEWNPQDLKAYLQILL